MITIFIIRQSITYAELNSFKLTSSYLVEVNIFAKYGLAEANMILWQLNVLF